LEHHDSLADSNHDVKVIGNWYLAISNRSCKNSNISFFLLKVIKKILWHLV